MTIDRFVDPCDDDDPGLGFLSSRTALVTGAGRRIGRELVLALAAEGAHVVIHHHTSADEARGLAKQINRAGGSADTLAGDLSDPDVAAALPSRATEVCGNPLDILINNAALFLRCGAGETSSAQWDALQAVNLRAPFLLAQGFAEQLPANWRADIINLNDARALSGDPDHFAYSLTKVSLHELTRDLARSLAPRIQVNELSLGAVLAPEGDPNYVKTQKSELPTGEFPTLDDVISGMMFLLGTRGVTGQSIAIDGGQFLK